ncbi:SGNH/GDSL hydrolase family protein [Paraburkholderia hospita]|jgi:phospholipase/lecithinase/hemolysin|uniref:SGNH/GDSL hydrolase family protein n=1 Tax=Paraburkholderia hospita TaxID=169430 RepID=UPI000B342AD7|nr:SGNH/GDSL hydrolase family protein [Paraburkholderia hospita]AXE97460.1 acylhydrolase [Paraburkholderia hospita]OUL68030.1 acylhydrolase [Paraburkholderia hospita]
MKQASNNTGVVRYARIAVACAAFATLVACGGGSDNNNNNNASATPAGGVKLQVVSFGDSLSDVGTYSPVITSSFGGGRFTTNPGEVWTQKVAEYYGDTLTPAYLGGFGKPLAANGGFGYAQGGSDVSRVDGNGFAPNSQAATTWPVTQQVQQYLTDHGSFNSNQLVLVNGGANDILQNLSAMLTSISTQVATNPTQASQIVQSVAVSTVGPMAQTLVAQIGTILAKGATHVVVMDVPDIGKTPLAAQLATQLGSAQVPSIVSGIVATYNGVLQQALAAGGLSTKVVYVSTSAWLNPILANPSAQGFSNTTGTACNITQMAANATAYATANPSVLVGGMTAAQYGQQFASSLFCSPNTLTVAGADQSYVFADTIHPTTHAHAAFATFVEGKIAATGLGK